MKLKTITQNLLKGDISSLFRNNDKKQLHPVEVAQVFHSLPFESILLAFNSFSYDNQLQIFLYLDLAIEKKLVTNMPPANAATLLADMSSDDRVTLYSSLKENELGGLPQFAGR